MKEDCLECKIIRRTLELGLTAYCLHGSTVISKFRSSLNITSSHKYFYLTVGGASFGVFIYDVLKPYLHPNVPTNRTKE